MIDEYRPRERWGRRLGIAGSLFLLAFLIALVATKWRKPYEPPPDLPPGIREERMRTEAGRTVPVLPRGVRSLAIPSVLVAGVMTLYYLIFTLRTLNLRVILCQNGFHFHHWRDRVPCSWTEVQDLYYYANPQKWMVSWTTYYCQVVKQDGSAILLPSPLNYLFRPKKASLHLLLYQIFIHVVFRHPLPRMKELCETIQEKATQAMLPRIRAALSRGEWVAFGPDLRISPEGIAHGEAVLSWKEVRLIRLGGGIGVDAAFLRIGERKKDNWWLEIHSSQVANWDALLELAEHHFRVRVERLSP